jgi:hypothetical protein
VCLKSYSFFFLLSLSLSNSLISEFQLKLSHLKGELDKLRDTKPQINNGLFIRLLLGQVNMRLWKQSDRIRFKDEYNKFKTRTTLVFILFPLIQLSLRFFTPDFYDEYWLHFCRFHHMWLIYYYLTLSIREIILLVNGSAILLWWIYHHYISLSLSLLAMIFPNPYVLGRFRSDFLWFALLQGTIMYMQNAYQKKRLYVRKTLGKAKAIDVDSSETLVEKPTDLKLLIPLLYALYAVEILTGVWFVRDFFSYPSFHTDESSVSTFSSLNGNNIHFPTPSYPLSTLVVGAGFLLLGLGNAYSTLFVLLSKKSARAFSQAWSDRKKDRK